MKQFINLVLSILLLMGTQIPGLSGTISSVSQSGNHPIIIYQGPSGISDEPRSPVFNPFFAELMNGYVILGSTTPCGTVSVHISSTAGDDYSTNFDTSDVTIIIPISGNPGDYTLTITTPLGAHFIGEFTI